MTVGYLFDLDWTLTTYDPGVTGIFANACTAVGVEPRDSYHEAFQSGYVETLAGFRDDPYVGAARAAVDAGLDIDAASLAEAYVEAELAATNVPAAVRETLTACDRVGVVTNGWGPVQRQKLAHAGIDDLVDAVVTADDAEAFKPADEPFDAITTAVQAENYVMVGDSVTYDIEPAAARDYRTVLVGDEPDEEGIADHRLSGPDDLDRLHDLLTEG